MLKLATVLDNPGEPFAPTQYRDPAALSELGYNGEVIYASTGLSGIESPDSVGLGEIGRWVHQQHEAIRQRVDQARAAGLDVFLCYDGLTLSRTLVQSQGQSFTCRRRPETLCPASDAALEQAGLGLTYLLQQIPGVGGVVLRFGDSDAERLPYLIGNDVYSPHCGRCAHLAPEDRVIRLIERFRRIVVEDAGLKLIARAWNLRPGGMHDSVDLCRRIVAGLPGDEADERLILSFKFTETDFWRYQRWNRASLVCGRRPIVYELQCQREFEGKGALPNWQVPLWRDGPTQAELAAASNVPPEAGSPRQAVRGLRDAVGKINFAGLWAWVRGGGWGGPFVRNETWIDANVFAVPRLVDRPDAEPRPLAEQWIDRRMGLAEPGVRRSLLSVLERSPEAALHGFYIGPLARDRRDPWHPNADWIQDDVLDASAAWRIIQTLPDAVLDEIVEEKQSAVAHASAARAELQQHADSAHRRQIEPLVNSLLYTESLFETLRDLTAGLVAFRRWQKHADPAQAEACRLRLMAAQSHWSHHTQRHGSLKGGATAFREAHFWDLTQDLLNQVARPAN